MKGEHMQNRIEEFERSAAVFAASDNSLLQSAGDSLAFAASLLREQVEVTRANRESADLAWSRLEALRASIPTIVDDVLTARRT
jgi:hypothetical protein